MTWMFENQVYFHLFVYFAIVIVSPHITQNNYLCNASQTFSHSHLKLNANKNVRYIQKKKLKGDDSNRL